MVPVVTLTRVGVAAVEEDERVTAQTPAPPTTTRAMMTVTIVGRLLMARRLRRTSVPSVRAGLVSFARRKGLTSGWDHRKREL